LTGFVAVTSQLRHSHNCEQRFTTTTRTGIRRIPRRAMQATMT